MTPAVASEVDSDTWVEDSNVVSAGELCDIEDVRTVNPDVSLTLVENPSVIPVIVSADEPGDVELVAPVISDVSVTVVEDTNVVPAVVPVESIVADVSVAGSVVDSGVVPAVVSAEELGDVADVTALDSDVSLTLVKISSAVSAVVLVEELGNVAVV